MITREKLQHHIKHLEEQHKDLELDLMEADLHWDEIRAATIKREKLKIKDEIESCKKQMQQL